MPNDPKLSHGAKNRKRGIVTTSQSTAFSPLAPARCLAHWIITQRTIHVVLSNKPEILRHEKPFPAIIKTVGDLLMARRKEAGLTRGILSKTTGIPLYWLGRWERDRAMPSPAEWIKLGEVLRLPVQLEIT
jgi:hypothetical protein